MAIFEGNHPQRRRKNDELAIAWLYIPVASSLCMGRGFSVAKATPLSAVATAHRASTRQQTCSHRIGGPTNMAATKCINSYDAGY